MPMMERPQVREIPGGKCWEHTFDKFELKAYVPDNSLDGQVNNYGFRAPCLLVFEENRQDMDSAVRFARETGLEKIAADFDTSVLFVYPTTEGGWAAGVCLCLLIIHICICGPKKTWNAVRDQWNSMRTWLKTMRDASKAEEEAKKKV